MTNTSGTSPLEALPLSDAFAGKSDQEILNLIASHLSFTAQAGASIQGEKGEKGDKGDTGSTGPQGAQGVQGVQGPAGFSSSESFIGIVNDVTTARQLSSGDIGYYLRMNNGGAITVTVPLHATDPIAVGSKFFLRQVGAGAITATPEGGVTINGTASSVSANDVLFLVKVADDEWDSLLI